MSENGFALSGKVVVLDDAGRCLLLKRSMESKGNPGKWEFPGGKADPGETFEEALLREVCEETGLEISLTRVAGAAQSIVGQRKIAYLIMEGRLTGGEVCLSAEHDDFVWIPRGELLTVDLPEQFRGFARRYLAEEKKAEGK